MVNKEWATSCCGNWHTLNSFCGQVASRLWRGRSYQCLEFISEKAQMFWRIQTLKSVFFPASFSSVKFNHKSGNAYDFFEGMMKKRRISAQEDKPRSLPGRGSLQLFNVIVTFVWYFSLLVWSFLSACIYTLSNIEMFALLYPINFVVRVRSVHQRYFGDTNIFCQW